MITKLQALKIQQLATAIQLAQREYDAAKVNPYTRVTIFSTYSHKLTAAEDALDDYLAEITEE